MCALCTWLLSFYESGIFFAPQFLKAVLLVLVCVSLLGALVAKRVLQWGSIQASLLWCCKCAEQTFVHFCLCCENPFCQKCVECLAHSTIFLHIPPNFKYFQMLAFLGLRKIAKLFCLFWLGIALVGSVLISC